MYCKKVVIKAMKFSISFNHCYPIIMYVCIYPHDVYFVVLQKLIQKLWAFLDRDDPLNPLIGR